MRQPAPKRVIICVTSLQLIVLSDVRDALAQTGQYCIMGNALHPETALASWVESSTNPDQLL